VFASPRAARFPTERLDGSTVPADVLERARPAVEAFLAAEGLGAALGPALEALIVPLSCFVAERRRLAGRPIVLGIAGAQGSGKTTLAALLALLLEHGLGLRAVALSLDDFYLTRDERARLARELHPLLATRGLPGSHDVALALRVLDQLLGADAGVPVHYPRFDKARDERVAEEAWPSWRGPTDVVVLEGVCLGAEPAPDAALATPINAFEREHDGDGRFRRYVDAQLAGPYRALFARVDLLVFLAVPDMGSVRRFRGEQERRLVARSPNAPGLLGPGELERFVQRFERISLRMLAQTPARADVVLRLDRDHACVGVDIKT